MTGLCKEGACAVFPACPGVPGRTDRFAGIARRRGGLRSPFLCADQDAMTSNQEHATLRTQRDGAYETIRDCQAKFLIRRCPAGLFGGSR